MRALSLTIDRTLEENEYDLILCNNGSGPKHREYQFPYDLTVFGRSGSDVNKLYIE